MSAIAAGVIDTNQQKSAYLTLSLIHAAGTYSFGTVSVGDVLILGADPYCSVTAAGFVSMTVQTDDTTATALLASLAVANVTGGKPLTSALTAPFVLPAGKHLTATLVGTDGTAGTIKYLIRYVPCSTGALIS